ncbi:uncharacterized protein [Anabrus simplex]|uniref:uncharacterized protein n=1 Tax=Anabrus simplex TaxID=316456 RepID=UPI0035A2DF0F
MVAIPLGSSNEYIIDPTISSEASSTQPYDVHEENCDTYELAIPYYAEKYHLDSIQILGSMTERTHKEYAAINPSVKRCFLRDKRVFINKLATEAEHAPQVGDVRTVYTITRQLANKKFDGSEPIKNKDGNLPTSDEPPTKQEIVKAIKHLKNGKAPGLDNVIPEAFKTNPEVSADLLHPLISAIWEKETFPEEWNKGLLIKLPKRGDLSVCDKWRGITLLSVPSKVLSQVILDRIKVYVDSKQSYFQTHVLIGVIPLHFSSLSECDLLEIDLLERLDSEDLLALRTHFFPEGETKNQQATKYTSGYHYSGQALKKDEFIKAVDTVVGNSSYSLAAAKFFQNLDTERRGIVWWEQLLDHFIERLGQRDQENGSLQPIDTSIAMLTASHCKRESIMKIVPIETSRTFCYAVVSKFGRVGVYNGQLQQCEEYCVQITAEGSGEITQDSGNVHRVSCSWVTDALYLPDAGAFLIVTSGRSMHLFDATSLIHAPLCYISGLKNSPQCLAYTTSSQKHPSMLFIGDDQGNIITMKFLQPKVSLLRKKHPDKLDKYYWVELETQPEWVSVSVDHNVHADAVRQISYCPDNDTIVSSSQDPITTLVVRHAFGRRTPYIFKLTRGVRCFHLERTLKLLATGSNDGVVRLWNPVVTKHPVVSLFGHKKAIVDVLILNHISAIISLSADGVLKAWDIDDQCCTQTLQLGFPSFSALGKTVEFGTRSLYSGPPTKAPSSLKYPSQKLSSTSTESAPSAEKPSGSFQKLLVVCCNNIAVLRLSPCKPRASTPSPLPPPSREHHPSVPSPWQAAAARGIITPDSSVYDQTGSPPETPTPPRTAVESKEETEEQENYLPPPSIPSAQYSSYDLNFRRTTQERRTRDMQMLVDNCAPHLALPLYDLQDIRFSRLLPTTSRMRELGVDVSMPENLLAGTMTGSASVSSLGSSRSMSHHGDRLTPDKALFKSRK